MSLSGSVYLTVSLTGASRLRTIREAARRRSHHAARLPVALRPVGGVEGGLYHAAAFRGVDEAPAADVDADVVLEPAGLEEHEVARLQAAAAHPVADLRLVFGAARQLPAEDLAVGELDEGRAVDALRAAAPVHVGGAMPDPVVGHEALGLDARLSAPGGRAAGNEGRRDQGEGDRLHEPCYE